MNAEILPSVAFASDQHENRVEQAPSLALSSNKWLRMTGNWLLSHEFLEF